MALFGWGRRRAAAEALAKAERSKMNDFVARLLPGWLANRPLASSVDYKALAEEGYRRNAVVYSCVREISTSMAEPPPVATILDPTAAQRQPLPPDHRISQILQRPNDEMDWAAFVEQLYIHDGIMGEFFIQKRRNTLGEVLQLWPLRPDRVSPVPNKEGRVMHYEYSIPGERAQPPIDAKDMIHRYQPDPLNDFRGLSPLVVGARAGDLDNNAVDMLRAYFLNGGVPKGYLKFRRKVDKPDRDRAVQMWNERYGGVEGWSSTAALDDDVEYMPVGVNPKDLDMSSVLGVSETRLCQVYQVPPILIGARIGLEFATYSNYSSARRSFWEETLFPKFRRLSAALTHGLAAEFDKSILIAFDFAPVGALQENEDALWKRAIGAWNDGLLTRNEARRMMKQAPVEGGDVFKSSFDALSEDAILLPDAPAATQGRPRTEAEVLELGKAVREKLAAFGEALDAEMRNAA